MNNIYIFSVIIISSLFLTELIRRYTLKNNLLDQPNERSSHSIPTPRGGGMSIVVVFLIAVATSNSLPADIVWALMGSGVLVAAIGFWDDHGHLAARWRLLSHFIAAFWAIYCIGEIPDFQILDYSFEIDWIRAVVVAFILVWLLNLFNFMDGIDGIAASEAIFVSCGGAYFSSISGLDGLSFVLLILAASTMGFMLLNWPPAKIFMGDAGSGFLGIILGVLAYASISKGVSMWVWLILFGVFLMDASFTLIRRILSGSRWYEAHCSHAYQLSARRWGHLRITLIINAINLFWLFPMAYIALIYPQVGALIALLALLPLLFIVIRLKAGLIEDKSVSS